MDSNSIKTLIKDYRTRDISEILKKMKTVKHDDKNLYQLSEDKVNSNDKRELIAKGLEEYKEEVEKIIYEYEYSKPYKYCSIFRIIDGNIDDGIDNLKGKVSEQENINLLDDGLCTPKLYDLEQLVILKFNYLCKGATIVNGEVEKMEGILPLLIVIHKNKNIIEFRVSKINYFLKGNDSRFYEKRIDEMIDWVNDETIFNIEEIDVKKINEIAKKNKNSEEILKDQENNEIKVYGQKMELKAGSNAVLDAGISEDIVLPILGDLKILINENEDKFPPTHPFYNILMTFIEDTEEESTYPWVQLIWLNKVKAKQLIVKFRFDVLTERGYSIIEFHKNNAENKEMMKVAKFIENKCPRE
ncbi:TPA: hypothetical protein OZE58_001752 [Staphylococcus aureus]|uniref:hypothetical protein n=1 Tax=Staphylococcus aureus TaxID=1280 RepID=UPI0021A9D102|nr:hypothetical protein [Staphylococcus aureus]EJN0118353.1 hypothetical protein [Staphylococcus aureus]MCT4674902.1 hypothetical protein [Staphylococcus aureus]HCX2110495.1 hypothetical protein [Staphylococcus aureus]HCX2389203.1 hypothetical protein [Staphylococcus aureus]HCX2544398.1 hypothetical protein [Staphylococcus aureus]